MGKCCSVEECGEYEGADGPAIGMEDMHGISVYGWRGTNWRMLGVQFAHCDVTFVV